MESNNLDSRCAITRNPATGGVIASHRFIAPDEVQRSLDRNATAFQEWRATPMEERVAAYHRLSGVLRGRIDALVTLITAEMEKTIASARAEIEKCASTIDWIAQRAVHSGRGAGADRWPQHRPCFLSAPGCDSGGDALELSFLASHSGPRRRSCFRAMPSS